MKSISHNELILDQRAFRDDSSVCKAEKKIISSIINAYQDPVIRLYCTIRFKIIHQRFLREIGQYLPSHGTIIDLGCGFGLFSLYYASQFPSRKIIGIDRDAKRIEQAKQAAAKLKLSNVTYRCGDVTSLPDLPKADAIYVLDILHHLTREASKDLLRECKELLISGGTLLIKDVAQTPKFKMLFTLLLDKLMYPHDPALYWDRYELLRLLNEEGFQKCILHDLVDILPYSHILCFGSTQNS